MEDGTGDDRQFATTLANGLGLLTCFGPGDTALAHRDFVARTDLTKANVSRLAFTLVQLGYLRHDAASGRYLLGSPVLSMGYPLLASMHIRQIARPFMRDMAEELGASVSLGLRDRGHMVYVDTSRADAARGGLADIGTALPLHGSAMGWAWLAAVPAAERRRALNQALAADPAGGGERTRQAEAALVDFGTLGYCRARTAAEGRSTVAVPVHAPVDSQTVVFDCSLPCSTVKVAAVERAAGQRLLLMVRSVEVALGLR